MIVLLAKQFIFLIPNSQVETELDNELAVALILLLLTLTNSSTRIIQGEFYYNLPGINVRYYFRLMSTYISAIFQQLVYPPFSPYTYIFIYLTRYHVSCK